ncbi:MAG: oligopeptide/dipeptide ABC transporter ATP-binding protein [Clostridiaceae bacterium]|nr:oligopeptide/dipeptide ABC transporter ATP-binding protein [Clostridiaceae bacterium]
MSTPLIETRDLEKYFKTSKGMLHAVDGVNLTIGAGDTLGVVGESGCGKSTLGRTILRLIEPTSGEVLYNGKNIAAYTPRQMLHIRREMQIIFQDPFSSLNPRMSVSDIIAEPLRVCGLAHSKAELYSKVDALMETVGLAQRFENAYPHELDGGRRQRIGIARALAVDPRFIVCDEPVSALDVSIQAQILNLLMDLQEQMGLTYLFITHDLSVVRHISTEIVVMYLGQCVERAPSALLFENPMHPYTQALLTAIPVPRLLPRKRGAGVIKGEVTNPIDPPPGCRFAARCPQVSARCRDTSPALREREPSHFVACTLYEEENV